MISKSEDIFAANKRQNRELISRFIEKSKFDASELAITLNTSSGILKKIVNHDVEEISLNTLMELAQKISKM